MKNPQVINLNEDYVLAFDGDNVIDDTDQLPLGTSHSISSVQVDVVVYDVMAEMTSSVINITMTYQPKVDFWTISLSDISTILIDRRKYIGLIAGNIADENNMRKFKIKEFCIDNDSFEATWMRLPYQVEIGTPSMIRWYAASDPTYSGSPLFEAHAYQGGTGNISATSAANVTHRGSIIPIGLTTTTTTTTTAPTTTTVEPS
jgi:hypothetical protein